MDDGSSGHVSLWRQATAGIGADHHEDRDGTTDLQPSHDEIAACAYARYVSRQGVNGSADLDWLEAEQQLSARPARPSGDAAL